MKRFARRTSGRAVTLALSAACAAWAAPAWSADTPAPDAWTYPNGLRVVFIPSPGAPMTACVALVGTGSAAEDERMYGSAHLLEHLLFNGTSGMSQEELYAAFDRIGAYVNAATRKDYTMFQVLAPREHQERAAGLLAKMLFDSTIPPGAFGKEKGIVTEEIRQGLSPAERVHVAAARALFAGTPFARTSIGTEEEIGRIDRADVVAFYERYYTPPNVVLVVMGAGDAAEVREWLQPHFGTGSRPPFARAVPRKPEWTADGVWSTAPAPDGRWRLVARYPAPAPGTPDYPAAVMLAAALDRHVIAPPDLPPLPELSAAVDVGRWFTHLEVSVPFHPADPAEALVAWRASVRNLAASIPADLDLDPVRTYLAFEDASLRQRPHYYPFFRAAEFLTQPTVEMANAPLAVTAVDVAAVRAVAHRIFTGPHAAVVLVPDGESAAVAAPPVGAPPPAPTSPEPVPAGEAQLQERWTNGLLLQVRQEPGLRVGAIHLLVDGRVTREPAGQAGAAELLHRCLLGGTGARDEAELQHALTNIGATVKTHDDARIPYDDYYLSPAYSYVRLEVLDAYLPDALAFLADVLANAAYPEEVVTREREQLERDATVALHGAGSRARRILYKALFGEDTWAAKPPLGLPSEIRALTPEHLRAMHAGYFTPRALTVTVVSGSAPVRVRDLARAVFGGAPGAEAASEPPSEAASPKPARPAVIEEPANGGQAQLTIGQVVRVHPEDRAAVVVADAHLSERIAQVLREERGWAYSVGCGVDWGAPAPAWLAGFAGAAEHLEAAQSVIREEVERLQREELSDDAVERARNGVVGRHQMRRLSAINRAFFWAMQARRAERGEADLVGETLASLDVSPAQVRDAARAMWRLDEWTVVRLAPQD